MYIAFLDLTCTTEIYHCIIIAMQPLTLLLQNATLPDGSQRAIGIQDGCIAWMGSGGEAAPPSETILDLSGKLLCFGMIDGHIHLDKTFLGAHWIPHVPGETVRERIRAEKTILREMTVPLEARASALIELAVSHGSTTLRSHVDIHPDIGLNNLKQLLTLRERFCDRVDIQIVAFPQSGLLSCPGTAELMEAAIQNGADLVGGLDPAGIDGDIKGHLDVVFKMAERWGVGLDIHLHDPDHLGIYELEQIARRTSAMSLQGRVTVSHAYALGMVSESVMLRTADLLADAGVAIMTNAPGNRDFPPIDRLHAAGVIVFAGSDNIRDAWWPFGNADMLERAMMIAYRSGFRTDKDLAMAFEMTTKLAAKALNVNNYDFEVGAPADFVAMIAQSIPEAVVNRPVRDLVIKRGHIVT
jgi:cytosine deaminase